MEKPCNNCADRKWYAKKLDIHFSDEDCPYVCQEYEQWKNIGKDKNYAENDSPKDTKK